MDKSPTNWKTLSLAFSDKMKDALEQQHYAAQFIAKAGRHLIPQQPDDSNTNMEYIEENKWLLGNPMPNGMQVALYLPELKLFVLSDCGEIKKTISLNGKTKNAVFAELAQNLADLGIDVSNFKNELHYQIPEHPIANGGVFSTANSDELIENTKLRHNANIILNEIASEIENAEPVKIWPHHFDTGSFITVATNSKGEASQTIGIGYAIADSMVNEPYFYLSFWSDGLNEAPEFEPLPAGRWMMPQWNGAVLTLSDMLTESNAEAQHQMVKSFFEQGIKTAVDFLNRLKTA